MATVLQLLAGVLILLGTIVVFLTAVALYRVRDAVTRVNALSPVTVLGVPSLQPLPPAPGLVLRDTLAGVRLADLTEALAARDAVDARA